MILKIILTILISIFVYMNINIEKREYIKPLEQLIMANPISLKIATNIYSVFYADKFWLLSGYIDEFNKGKDKEWNLNKMEKGYTVINYLDPNFTQPIVYVVSYMIINENKYEQGMRILNNAIKKSPNNPKLLFQKLIYITTYNPNKPDIKEIMHIAKILYNQDVIYQGVIKVSDFVAELVEYNTKSEKDKIKNLKRLLKFTKDKEITEDIKEILKKYKKKEKENE